MHIFERAEGRRYNKSAKIIKAIDKNLWTENMCVECKMRQNKKKIVVTIDDTK